ncbi:hypothetical protein UFOVP891_58 [uncultured Caudovirales phage]|uniref:Uncharacterized protein n=1 Tax=uncultured Caudovirales phage TaxID=2100421 RepID=A0A6J5T3T5_9CAUD|nr:hypothetical protein UFOVP472_9 [uncultured Caudovirales phage]CAB4169233.1 hypothetical protein UFOVP891_58 [uncultured Caudovirales phage]CAB4180749.1 hypothetical protein UFOVP1053_9 [uncultured Caudovirales phage]CAB4195269.1 hypothetical protein UFOVP1297_2 [uncultured Caudovirales phage]CAB4221906.1 hypothetical protein UFOVP1647_42 [uncultured Caudovirales phage]
MKSVRTLDQLRSIGIQSPEHAGKPKDDAMGDLAKAISASTAAQEKTAMVNAHVLMQIANKLQPSKETVVVEAKRPVKWIFTCKYDDHDRISSITAEAEE